MITFIKDYKTNEILRKSFDALAQDTFGISFEKWYQNGYWNENYMTYSFHVGDRIVSNASANKMTLMIDGKEVQAIQIGTVMTHPEYRKMGLAHRLIQSIIEEFKEVTSLFFLAADRDAISLYSKLGFVEIASMNYTFKKPEDIKKSLNFNNESLHLSSVNLPLEELQNIKVNSPLKGCRFEVVNDVHILAFYWFHGFDTKVYRLNNETLIIADINHAEKKMILYDYFYTNEQTFSDLLDMIWNQVDYEIDEIKLEFDIDVESLPDCISNSIERLVDSSSGWMVYEHKGSFFPRDIHYPKLAQA